MSCSCGLYHAMFRIKTLSLLLTEVCICFAAFDDGDAIAGLTVIYESLSDWRFVSTFIISLNSLETVDCCWTHRVEPDHVKIHLCLEAFKSSQRNTCLCKQS